MFYRMVAFARRYRQLDVGSLFAAVVGEIIDVSARIMYADDRTEKIADLRPVAPIELHSLDNDWLFAKSRHQHLAPVGCQPDKHGLFFQEFLQLLKFYGARWQTYFGHRVEIGGRDRPAEMQSAYLDAGTF